MNCDREGAVTMNVNPHIIRIFLGMIIALMSLGNAPFLEETKAFEVVAHRGYSSQYPENTMAAFEAAYLAGAHHFEVDIRATLDNEIVCLHDSTLDRTTDCTGSVGSVTYSYVEGCDAGSWFDPSFTGEPVPRLYDLLNYFSDKEIGIYIELKTGGLEEDLLELLSSFGMSDKVTVISFGLNLLDDVLDALSPGEELDTIWLQSTVDPSMLATAVSHDLTGVGVAHDATAESIIDAAHELNLLFNVWTVNDSSDMRQFVNWGVDTLTTDYPDRALGIGVCFLSAVM